MSPLTIGAQSIPSAMPLGGDVNRSRVCKGNAPRHQIGLMQLLFRSDHSLRQTRAISSSEQVLAPGPRHHQTPHVGVCRSLLPSDQLMSMSQTDAAPKQGFVGWLQRSWVCRSSRADAGTLQQESSRLQAGAKGLAASSFKASPTHLIVMVNGLFGSAANWDVICEQLQQHLPPDTLLHPSRVNAR